MNRQNLLLLKRLENFCNDVTVQITARTTRCGAHKLVREQRTSSRPLSNWSKLSWLKRTMSVMSDSSKFPTVY